MSDAQADTLRLCYRCSKAESETVPLRLLPGSTHITLCTDCYEVVWGWHEVMSTPAPGVQPGRKSKAEAGA